MSYVVNVDKPARPHVTVHNASCPAYPYWDGVKAPENGGWFGLYDTEAEILAKTEQEGFPTTSAGLKWANCPCSTPRSHKS